MKKQTGPKYYQPYLKDSSIINKINKGEFSISFVFRSKKLAEKIFPGVKILVYSGDDIEEATFVDNEFKNKQK